MNGLYKTVQRRTHKDGLWLRGSTNVELKEEKKIWRKTSSKIRRGLLLRRPIMICGNFLSSLHLTVESDSPMWGWAVVVEVRKFYAPMSFLKNWRKKLISQPVETHKIPSQPLRRLWWWSQAKKLSGQILAEKEKKIDNFYPLTQNSDFIPCCSLSRRPIIHSPQPTWLDQSEIISLLSESVVKWKKHIKTSWWDFLQLFGLRSNSHYDQADG